MDNKEYLDLRAILIVFALTIIWGFNFTTIKYSVQGISPIFASALRSIIASAFGVIYCLSQRERLFHTDIMLFHGFMVGLLFALEFICIYFGMLYTEAGRSVIFIYFSPFVVALGAHFFLVGDRLTVLKVLGLILSFMGILVVFGGKPQAAKETMLKGDVLQIMAAFFWGATTLYIKRFMAGRIQVIHTYLYQVVFSIPILLVVSLIVEPQWVYRCDRWIVGSVLYQSVIVAFISYFIWFKLIHTYSVSRLSAFTFLTPIFGVVFGTLLLHEEFTVSVMVGLPMVCLGIFLVNWRRRVVPSGPQG